VKYLGLRLAEPDRFLNARVVIDDNRHTTKQHRLYGIYLDTVLLAPFVGKIVGLSWKLRGYSGLPKSSDPLDILTWNADDWDGLSPCIRGYRML
jgi:hypothetical protein